MEQNLNSLLDPWSRQFYLQSLLLYEGILVSNQLQENPLAAYCPISLTSVPTELKEIISVRQTLLKKVLEDAGITAYDPATAPYSPDKNLESQPQEIYTVDSQKILAARFFVGHNILPSTGQGVELEKARMFNRIAVILMDKRIRVSRMLPSRVIYLQYDNFEKDADKFVSVFRLLKDYHPGMGSDNGIPVLLGFHKETNTVVNLEQEIYNKFPELKYHYDGTTDIVKLLAKNPEIFYEKQ